MTIFLEMITMYMLSKKMIMLNIALGISQTLVKK